jgi:hypothetical protein
MLYFRSLTEDSIERAQLGAQAWFCDSAILTVVDNVKLLHEPKAL